MKEIDAVGVMAWLSAVGALVAVISGFDIAALILTSVAVLAMIRDVIYD